MSETVPSSWFQRLWRSIPELLLLLLVLSLCLLGLIMLSSVGQMQPGREMVLATKQSLWLAISVLGFFVTLRLNLEKFRELTPLIAAVALVLLILVLIPGIGSKVNGARRWINLGPMNVQVSDFAKIALVFVMAHYLAIQQRHIHEFWRGFILPGILIGVVAVSIMLQPDFGTAFLCAAVGGCLMFLAGTRMIFLVPTAMLFLSLFAVAVYHDPVRFARIMSFLDVEGNRSEGAYQLWQGLLAFGVGGVNGVGIGQGRQQMAFLPEAHTDFIFPIIGEELGLLATSFVVMAFLTIFLIIMLRLRYAPNMFQFLLVIGCGFLLILQALINCGVATGLLPTKGMSLPFISYGGSNLLSMFLMLGIMFNCFSEWGQQKLKRPFNVES
ncbi:MAG: FtsW/RodA/SpoVE family cell cycle protein [Verrucomicrobia bacterium]|nr:FtsW/RodA/SpoVE family cell cycle protein [Verrucomicrobiota bacterium]